MNRRTRILTVTCLLALVGAWLFWPHGSRKGAGTEMASSQRSDQPGHGPNTATNAPVASAPKILTLNTNKLAYRLSNTTDSIGQLLTNSHAILLENALIDTKQPMDLKIPAHLRSAGDPGIYIVQARGATSARFRAALLAAGGTIGDYFPNNAYLVTISASGAGQLAGNSLVQAVVPYEPYYKIQYSLLGMAVDQQPLPPGMALNLGVSAADAATADQTITALGAKVIGHDRSGFETVVRVLAPSDWTELARSRIVQRMEPAHSHVLANDLSRVTVGISPDTTSAITNDYLGLSGLNVLVAVNDTGIDVNHPDFSATGTAQTGPTGATRVVGLNPIDMVDTNGHGTHVAGIIAGNGSESLGLPGPLGPGPNVGAFAEGSVSNADFRGKAPLANLFSLGYNNSDYVLQTNAAMVNALISNNSWDYGNGDAEYDMAAASYDFATRDALPYTTGSQPVLFVFAAGNIGGGQDDGSQGAADTIESPGTSKNGITVGALEQFRDITNIVTTITPGVGTNAPTTNQVAYWQQWTDSGNQVAWYSSRGNVGVGTEGTYGRFKPDVVSPGTFVVSTRSSQWDTNAYYNPTNVIVTSYTSQIVQTNGLVYYNVAVPPTAVAVTISIFPNIASPNPFPPNLLIYAKQSRFPDQTNYDILTSSNNLDIPPSSGGAITGIQAIQGNGFSFAVGDSTNFPVNYDMLVAVYTTNNVGDQYSVLQGMNEQLAPYYRYETGTSMAAADVSGVLALIADYFTNTLALTPSPALMKAVLINGSRSVGDYGLALTNGINFQGWGLDNIQNCIPAGGLTYKFNQPGSSFFVEQNPTNALATGDSHTFMVTLDTTTFAQYLQLQATLVWTDPPGDPAAAIKLVNNLDLVITNLDTGEVYFGNDISPDVGFNQPWDTNGPPNLDSINNVENILLPPMLAGSYSVTVVGRSVNVNAVTAQTNNAAGLYAPNVVQDFALVVSLGEGEVTNAFSSMTDSGIASNPTGDQDLTIVTTTNAPLFGQIAGASSPLLGTNTVGLGTNTVWGPNGAVTIGMTNQWHFYIVTNSGPAADFTNAAFITFQASTLSIPRMGVYQDNVANATRPEADIDLYVSQDPSITNLSPVAISNALAGTSIGGVGNGGAALTQGGTEFVFFTNSHPGQIYYVGVKSEDREGAEYAFLPVFTDIPFSSLDQNGNQIVHGLLLPQSIPDGNNAHPGITNVFALAILPMEIEKVIVTNLDEHQNFGDLFGVLSFGGQHVVLNNHDGFGNTIGHIPIVYDDTPDHPLGTTNTDGPGSLVDFRTKSALGPWILGEQDNAPTHIGQVSRFDLLIQPHRNLNQPGIIVSVPPGGWFIDYVDVPVGYTNLTLYATNVTLPTPGTPPIQMYERLGNEPDLVDYDQRADLTNGTPPGNSISVGPPLAQGRYFVGLYNPNLTTAQNVFISSTLDVNQSVNDIFNFVANSSSLFDDAVTNSSIFVSATQAVSTVNVGMVVNYSRVSDLTFTLVSPTGQRVLLMENRGGSSTNIGHLNTFTNFFGTTTVGDAQANTNTLSPVPNSGTLLIDYDFQAIPDTLDVYYDGVNIFSSGLTYFAGQFVVPYGPGASTSIQIVMNNGDNSNPGTAWSYTPMIVSEDYNYVTFTDDTNLAQVPIKFAIPPFDIEDPGTNLTFSDFELATNGDYRGLTNIYDAYGGWTVPTNLVTILTIETNGQFVQVTNTVVLSNNLVSVLSDPHAAQAGTNYLALADGTITRTLPFTVGRKYQVTYTYRGPGISGWWRGEGNASDSSDPENNGNNGTLIGRFNYPAGVVGQAFQFEDPGNTFQFAATNTYIQVRQSDTLNVGIGGGFTVEGWINPTNLSRPEPLVEWLAHVPTNIVDTNFFIAKGPVLDPATGHYYYLLGATNWSTSEAWAQELGGHLVTIDSANEENWVYDTFTSYGTLNRDLWTGLGYTNSTGKFGWANGSTNLAFTDWTPGQPSVCGAADQHYVAIMGPTNAYPGLWKLEDDLGLTCDNPPINPIYGVVEVNDIQTNGVQFWISGTNGTPGTNTLRGCLYANVVDANFVSHEIFSAPGLLTTNAYQHVALTYNTNTGIAALYLNGTNVATTNLGVFVPKTDGDLLIGWDMSRYTNNFYGGTMDEMSVYSRALSLAEISAIYNISVPSTNGFGNTNGLIGKFDPSVISPLSLAKFQASLGSMTSTLYADNTRWLPGGFTFTAQTNSLPLQFTGLEPGVLLDTMSVAESALGNEYYFPEQALSSLTGSSAYGNWTLQVWDNRAGAYLTDISQIVSWELSFTLVSNAVIAASLPPQTPVASTVPAGQITYYAVTVPAWAHVATNILVSSDQPVNLFFNQTNPPTGSGVNDYTLLSAATSGYGFPSLQTNAAPPLLPLLTNQTYYLGVQNLGTHSATVTLEVDYDILALTNGVPFTSTLNTSDYNTVRYFSFDVTSNAYETTFQLLKLRGNADLVIHKGLPLPDLTNSDYGSFNVGNIDENIYLLTNSGPVALSPGRWYVGVFKRDPGVVDYSVLVKELDDPDGIVADSYTIINLTNNVPFNWTAGPGAALTNFFHFHPVNSIVNGTNFNIQSLRFELYNLSGNGDLTLESNVPPLAPPFFQTSQNGGDEPELIFVNTNNVLTNLATDWYLGVPNREITSINFTIVAVIQTNGYFPAFPGASGAGGGAVGAGHAGANGSVYHVTSTADSGPGSLRDAVSAANRTVVFDIGGTIGLTSPLLITNSNLTIAGQTSPGGITVAGNTTAATNVHEVIIRDLRFRAGTAELCGPPSVGSGDSLSFLNTSNVIVDHISASWSLSNLVSVLNSSNVTVQWSIMADSLYSSNSSAAAGSLLREGGGMLSFNHNLYSDNYSGNPRIGDNVSLDFVNNVVYNWGIRSGLSDGTNDLYDFSTTGSTNLLNYVSNYLIAGPDTASFSTNNYNITNIAFFGGISNSLAATWIFQTNNFIDSDDNGALNGSDTGWAMFTNDYTRFGRPFPTLSVPVDEAYIAYERVLDFAGMNMSQRDSIDTNIVTGVRYQTGRMISTAPLVVPGIIAWWKGENNFLDSVGGNNATPENGIGFLPGEVGTGFNLNSGQFMIANPATPSSLDVGQGAGFTFEEWIKPTVVNAEEILFEYEDTIIGGAANNSQMNFAIHSDSGGVLYANITDTNNVGYAYTSPAGLLVPNVWQHVAMTYDKASGIGAIYINGVAVTAVNLGSFTPATTFTNICFGGRTLYNSVGSPGAQYSGQMDEITMYNTALCSETIAAIYNAGRAGKFAAASASTTAALPYLDTDQDGLPDFWENTFLPPGMTFAPSANNDRDGDGYTDLEEYDNWLAGPHALAVTNTSVAVDLYQLCGESGHLAFFLTNSVHGFAYLTNATSSATNTGPWSNSIAIFTPTNSTYSGYASFSFYVTNIDTAAYFGPVPVSVIVSAVPIQINSNMPPVITPLISGVSSDPTNYGGSDFYSVVVTTNDVGALFEIDDPTGPMAMVISDGLPLPSLSSYAYYTNAPSAPANQYIAVLTNSTPVPLAPGTWYMAAVNESGSNVIYTAKITLLHGILPPEFIYPTNTTVTNILETVPFAVSCVATDLDMPALPLSFAVASGPAGLTISNGVIRWTPTEAQGPSTNLVTISVSNGAYTITNTFTIDVEESNLPPVLPFIPNQVAIVPGTLVVVDTAMDTDIPTNALGYTLSSTVPGPNLPVIDTNGIVTWTTSSAPPNTNFQFTVTVTDTNPWAVNAQSLSATHTFTVYTLPGLPPGGPLTNIIAPNGTNWYAIQVPTNAILATNSLLFATLPVNLWFSTNIPPSTDYELLANTTSGISVLSTNRNTAPTNIVQDGIYFLGMQNPNSVAVTNALRVDFAYAASLTLPFQPDQYIAAGDTLVVTNTAMDSNPSAALTYSLASAPAGAIISGNGIITWATLTNMPVPATVQFTTIVTDAGAHLSATNSFNVTVLPGLVNDQPQTNIVGANGINWFVVRVPVNADIATNFLLFATAPVNLWFSTNVPPSTTGLTDSELLANSTGGSRVINLTSTPVLVPGSRYFLGVQNNNGFGVTNAVKVSFHLVPPVIYSITPENIAGTNGFLITWFAPSGFQFHLQWSSALAPANWINFNGVISFTSFIAVTNSEFQYFDDGSQTGGFGPTRFYRLLLLNSPTNTAPFFLNMPTIFYVSPSNTFVFTNTAKDWDIPAQALTYSITNTLDGANVTIDTNTGAITWTPNMLLAGQTNVITTTVVDNGVPPKSATNVFEVVVSTNTMAPPLSISIVSTGIKFQWIAPTNEQFQIQWTTNLAPPNWQVFPTIITSTSNNFSFIDTNMPLMWMKFYELILLP